MRNYPDLHEHLEALDKAGLLVRVARAINKDTEMHPLVRWQFRGGIAEKDRKAFLFNNVTDSKGRKYDIPVVVGALAASREIYRIGMNCPLDKINEVWTRAIAHPVAPNVVKAKTVDLLVPAESEIVVEGWIDTEYLEPEAPFGESHGHVNLQEYNAFMEVTCITRRKNAILTSIISQVTPSESSLIKRVALEPLYTHHLRNTLGIQGVKRVSMHEPLTNLRKVVVLIMDRKAPRTEIWRALYGAAAWNRAAGKYVVAVNEDIEPDNADALLWAMSYRANPALDLQILHHRDQGHGPRSKRNDGEDASVLIDATMKEDFPPISLPKREYMERAKKIWEELGLPKLKPESPWFGYSLGEWPDELERAAELAVKGDYFETGKLLVKRRRKDVRMNTEVRDVQEPKKDRSSP